VGSIRVDLSTPYSNGLAGPPELDVNDAIRHSNVQTALRYTWHKRIISGILSMDDDRISAYMYRVRCRRVWTIELIAMDEV
jgi:hypothetical protein